MDVRDEWGCLFNATSSRFQLFISILIPPRRFSHAGFIRIPFPIPSVITIPSRWQFHASISSHLLLPFMDIMKPITRKFTTNGSLLVVKTTLNQIKNIKCLRRLPWWTMSFMENMLKVSVNRQFQAKTPRYNKKLSYRRDSARCVKRSFKVT